jgi:hypothetical protein
VVVTETGVENFHGFLPSELDEIERIVGQDGIVQAFPPKSEAEFQEMEEMGRR